MFFTFVLHNAALGQEKCKQSNNQTINRHFFVRRKVYHRAGQLSLPRVEITKTERNGTKTYNIDKIKSVNGLEP